MTTLLEINTQRGGPYSAGLGKTEANYEAAGRPDRSFRSR
jgi:hypothetical protein